MKKLRVFIPIFVLFCILVFAAFLLSHHNFQLFNSKGIIALEERNLILTAVSIMLVVVIPVFIFTIFIAWKFRAGNINAKHALDSTQHISHEIAWWAILTTVMLILSVIMWKATHKLDPFKSISSNNKPITIQVIALRWKWLFIYPEYKVATVNFIQFPVNTPVRFDLTADAPMNSFWIPQLGGQMYAMSGMGNHLNLIANTIGEYNGSTAEISGAGFAGMKFIAKVSTQEEFDNWIKSVKKSGSILDFIKYEDLSKPSEDNPVNYYSLVEENLYDKVIMKFMAPITPEKMESDKITHMEGM